MSVARCYCIQRSSTTVVVVVVTDERIFGLIVNVGVSARRGKSDQWTVLLLPHWSRNSWTIQLGLLCLDDNFVRGGLGVVLDRH